MKIIITIVVLINTVSLSAQDCFMEEHSVNHKDMWLSCSDMQNPNPSNGNSKWILYDLGYTYNLGTSRFWNYNETGKTDRGIKSYTLDISLDGNNWINTGTYHLDEAPGNSQYSGQLGPDLRNRDARFILLTVLDTWGHFCAGVSEVKFHLGTTPNGDPDIYIDNEQILVLPDKNLDTFVILGNMNHYKISIVDGQGHIIDRLDNSTNEIVIHLHDLPNQIHLIRIQNETNSNLFFENILKN